MPGYCISSPKIIYNLSRNPGSLWSVLQNPSPKLFVSNDFMISRSRGNAPTTLFQDFAVAVSVYVVLWSRHPINHDLTECQLGLGKHQHYSGPPPEHSTPCHTTPQRAEWLILLGIKVRQPLRYTLFLNTGGLVCT